MFSASKAHKRKGSKSPIDSQTKKDVCIILKINIAVKSLVVAFKSISLATKRKKKKVELPSKLLKKKCLET